MAPRWLERWNNKTMMQRTAAMVDPTGLVRGGAALLGEQMAGTDLGPPSVSGETLRRRRRLETNALATQKAQYVAPSRTAAVFNPVVPAGVTPATNPAEAVAFPGETMTINRHQYTPGGLATNIPESRFMGFVGEKIPLSDQLKKGEYVGQGFIPTKGPYSPGAQIPVPGVPMAYQGEQKITPGLLRNVEEAKRNYYDRIAKIQGRKVVDYKTGAMSDVLPGMSLGERMTMARGNQFNRDTGIEREKQRILQARGLPSERQQELQLAELATGGNKMFAQLGKEAVSDQIKKEQTQQIKNEYGLSTKQATWASSMAAATSPSDKNLNPRSPETTRRFWADLAKNEHLATVGEGLRASQISADVLMERAPEWTALVAQLQQHPTNPDLKRKWSALRSEMIRESKELPQIPEGA